MLSKFSVTNFRGFDKTITLRLDQASDYRFQNDLVQGDFISKAIIYGNNGSGKSSLCNALADIVSVLTDTFQSTLLINPLNYGSSLNPINTPCTFDYEILEAGERIRYVYAKNRSSLLEEHLYSNEKEVLSARGGVFEIDYSHFPELKGTSFLTSYNKTVSLVKYLSRTGLSFRNPTIERIVRFAQGLLLFRSLIYGNEFAGFLPNSFSLAKLLEKDDGVKDFEEFLHDCGIDYKLVLRPTPDPNAPDLLVRYPYELRSFFDVASSGTQYLLLFYTWIRVLEEKASLLIIDEFDAYYHDDVAVKVFNAIRKRNYQTILTTHRTCLMQNSTSRPDCVFLLNRGSIKPINQLTDRELREANNIEKLYRNGAFSQ